MGKIDRLIEKCSVVTPLEGRVLIAPNKLKTYKDKAFKSSPVDPDVKEDEIIPGETEMKLEEVITDVNCRYQTAVVLSLPADETRFKVGDTIIYNVGTIQEFDYIKGVSLIRKYDVVGVLSR